MKRYEWRWVWPGMGAIDIREGGAVTGGYMGPVETLWPVYCKLKEVLWRNCCGVTVAE